MIAGVNGTDPPRVMRRFLGQVSEAGFSGVNNFPTVGLFDGAESGGSSRPPTWASPARWR